MDNFARGQALIIELRDECFVGEFAYSNEDGSRIHLINVLDVKTGETVPNGQTFYKAEIKSIKIVNDDNQKESENFEKIPINKINCDDVKLTKFTTNELQIMDNMTKNAKYIYKTDRLYHGAIDDLWNQSEIAVNIESCEMGRYNRTGLLTICTRENVYIFDIVYLGKVYPEIKSVLEATKPRKIVHNGTKISDNLKFKQGIQLNSVFDTYVAHIILSKQKTFADLSTCICRYVEVPDQFLPSEKDLDWDSRPLNDACKKITARKTILIYKLYDVLLHDHMLQNFYNVCSQFSNFYSSNTDSVEVASDMASNKNSSVDQLSEAEIDLPSSLDQICMQD